MRSRSMRLGVATLTGLLAISGVAWATGAIQTSAVDTSATVYEVADAGTVTLAIEGTELTLLDVAPAAGWSATVDGQTAIEVEIDFTTEGRRVRFNAEIEDGAIRTRTEERVAARATDDSSSVSSTSSTSSTTSTTAAAEIAPSAASGDDQTFDVRGAGTVTLRVEGSTLVLVNADPAPGWNVSIDSQTVREVEIDFRIDGARIRFNGELEDGQIRARVEVRTGTAPDAASPAPANSSSSSEIETFDVPGIASITVSHSGSGLSLLTVTPEAGWTVDVEDADGDRIRIEFESGEREVEFEARFDDGRFRYEIDEKS